MKPELSIIIVTYNSEKQIGSLLDSIYRDRGKINLEVIVIDNQSADNSLLVAKNHKINPICIQMGSNSGFPTAVNKGIKIATGDYYFLLNPDTILTKGCLTKLLEFAKDTDPLGAVAPRLLYPDGKPQASVFKFPNITNAISYYFLNSSTSFNKYLPDNRTQIVEVAMMAAFLIPKLAVDIVGGLDEKFFMYYEDIEFCRRLSRAGLPVYYYPTAKVKHIHGASGHFKSHAQSPLLASARLYHGTFYSNVLNFILWAGQKWQKIRPK